MEMFSLNLKKGIVMYRIFYFLENNPYIHVATSNGN